MKHNVFSSTKADWPVAVAAGVLLSAAALAAEYPGYAKVENFDGVTGGIAGLQAAAKYTNNQPDSVTFVDSLYYSRNPAADTYGSRVSGYLMPAETATYVFFVAADDNTSLYLSTDSSPANLKLVAADQGWQNSRTWTGPGGESSGAGTVDAVFRRGSDPGDEVMAQNGYLWVEPFENRSDQFLNSPRANLAGDTERWPNTDAGGNAVINLTANQKYYFELLYTEGSGGENTGVAWKKAGDPDPNNGDPEITGEFLSVDHTDTLTFMAQPESQTVPQGQPVAFTVDVLGVPGDSDPTLFTYEWLLNGQAIADAASAATYTVLSPALSDTGNKYSVRVTTLGGLTGTSTEATLTVVSDNVPPTIARIRSSDTFDSAKVTFSEAVRNEAVDPANYSFTGGLTVTDANFDIVVTDPANPEDPKNPFNPANRVSVVLFTSQQTEGASYDLTLSNVQDVTGNALTPNTAKMFANVFQAGILNYKRWEGGNNIANLISDPLRYANPTVSETRTIAETGGEAATYVAGVYVDRVDGFFIPTETATYVFYMSADNDGYLYLSTDSAPANRKMIAADVGWQNTREWTGPGGDDVKRRGDLAGGGPFENRSDELLTSQRAVNGTGLLAGLVPGGDGEDPEPWPTVDANGNAVISLTAGQRYAFQLWHVEGDSGRAEATFKYADEEDPALGTLSRITNTFIGAFVDPSTLPPVITTHPTDNVTIPAGGTATLSVVVDGAGPLSYQWQHNGKDIPGATSDTYTIANATPLDIGQYWVTVSNSAGTATSGQGSPNPTVVLVTGTGVFNIEAEDFDYGSGQTKAEASTMPYTGAAYDGLSAVFDVDYHNTGTTTEADGWTPIYRTGDPITSGTEAEMQNNDGGQWGRTRAGEWDMTVNYKIGWIGTGDWGNYTRTFPTPAKEYYVFAAGSYDGVAASQVNGSLGFVTAGVGTTTQTVEPVGTFDAPGTGDWSRNNLVAMTDTAGNVKTVELGGTRTIRWTYNSGDADYLLFYPVGGATGPQFTSIKRNTDGTITVEWTGGGTLQAAPAVTGPWQDVTGATSPYTLTPDQAMLFGRVRQ